MESPAPSRRRTKPKGSHPAKALSAAFCRNVAQPGRYCDGNGLYVHVEPSGARRWVQRLVIHGKSRALGLGSFALVPLAEAREQALANRRLARAGGDPRATERRANGIPAFDEAVAKVIAIHGAAWKPGGSNANRWLATLREYAYPRLGGKGLDEVTTADVMAVLLPIWTRKHATAQQVRQRIGTVMKWAIAQGYRSDNPAADAVTAITAASRCPSGVRLSSGRPSSSRNRAGPSSRPTRRRDSSNRVWLSRIVSTSEPGVAVIEGQPDRRLVPSSGHREGLTTRSSTVPPCVLSQDHNWREIGVRQRMVIA